MKKGKKKWLTLVLVAVATAAAAAGILPPEVVLDLGGELLGA